MRAWMGVAVLAVAGAFGQAEPVAAGHHFVVEMTIAGSQEDAQREQKFEDFASDDTGRIWAAPRDRAQEIAAFRADGKGQLLGVRGIPTGARAWRLMRLPDGWVACLWRDSTAAERYAVTLHRGETTRVWAAFDGKLNEPRMLGCRDGALLITEKGPRVIRLTKGSAAAQSLTLPDALFHMPPKAPGASDERYYSPVCALEDEQQRVWLWSYALDAGNAWRLSALVALRGDEFEKKEIAGIAADARFSAVAVADGESLWLPVVGNRLCKLDLATFRAEPVEVPEPVAFRYVEKIFQAHGETWAVLSPQPSVWSSGEAGEARIQGRISLHHTTYFDPTFLTHEPWRLRGGRWERVQAGLDYTPRFGWLDRPILETPHGLFIGSNSAGPWFFPADPKVEAVWFWWERHFPLRDARQLCAAGGDAIFALDSDGDLKMVDAGPHRLVPLAQRAKSWRYRFRALQDRRGHVWGFRGGKTFEEWDGLKRIPHEPPEKFLGVVPVRGFVGDDRNRGWLLPDDGTKTAICDFATGKWEIFESYSEALARQLPNGVRLTLPDYPFFEPVFSGHGHIAFFNLRSGLSFFDGQSWRKWSIAEIGGPSVQVTGSPFFDRDQRLCLPLDASIFQLEAKGTWRHFEQADAPERTTRPREARPDLPAGLPVASPTSSARDRFGTYWLTTPRNELVKALPGVMAPAIHAGEGNPFRYGARIYEALVDPQGSAFLRTTGFATDYYEYVFLIRRSPPPETTIEKTEVTGDTARFRFSAALQRAKDDDSKAPVLFQWRVDGGAWEVLKDKNEITVSPLAAGEHRVEVRAYGDDLVADPTPAEAKFVVQIDPAEQQRKLLAQLASPDLDERERAARALNRLGAAALPMLRAHREGATPDVGWWIQAVIQQIERAQKQPAD